MERRQHERHTRTFSLTGLENNREVQARMVARDLSLSGLSCTSDICFDEMTRLALRLMLPIEESADPEVVDLEAVVVRHRPLVSTNGDPRYELALFFTGVQEEARDKLKRYLEN